MNLHETRHARGERIAPHRHALAYAALVLEGSYDELGPDGVWRVEPGDLIVHPPFHFHLNRFESGQARVLNFTLPHPLARRLGASRYKVVKPRDPDRLIGGADADELSDALAQSPRAEPRRKRDWIDLLAAALCDDPRARIGALASAVGVTAEHAARAFAARYGMTPARFRAEQRLRTGLSALAESTRPLAEIAASAGYADQAHFSRAIAAATGASPARLRPTLI
jgi:AraC-like DNA-binding protein